VTGLAHGGGLGLAAVLAAGYRHAAALDRRGWSPWRTASWLAGCAVLAGTTLVGHGDPRAHMTQHVLLGMLAPVGLVLGAPVTLLLRVAGPSLRRVIGRILASRPVHVLGHPVTAALLSTGGLYLVMLTPLYSAAEDRPWLHAALHLHYLAAGYLFAWAIAGPDPAPRRPGLATRLCVLAVAAGAHAFLAKYLYAEAGSLLPDEPAEAVRSAAQIMYYGGDAAELLLAIALFATWYRQAGRLPSRTL
jgi:cytochrome c oxidase assembly factor CtaG